MKSWFGHRTRPILPYMIGWQLGPLAGDELEDREITLAQDTAGQGASNDVATGQIVAGMTYYVIIRRAP